MNKALSVAAMILVSFCAFPEQHRYCFAYMNCISYGIFVDYDLDLLWDDCTNQCQIVSHNPKIDTIFFVVKYTQTIDYVKENSNNDQWTVTKLFKENCQYDFYDIGNIHSRNANLNNIFCSELRIARNTQSMDVPEICLAFNIKTNKNEYRVEMVFTGGDEYDYNFQMLMRKFIPDSSADSSKYHHEEGKLYTNMPDTIIKWYKKYCNLKTTVDYYLYDNPEDFKRSYRQVEPGFDLKILHLLQGNENYSVEPDSLQFIVDAPHNINSDRNCTRFNDALLENAILNVCGLSFVDKYFCRETYIDINFIIEYDSMGYVLDVLFSDSSHIWPFDYDILAKIKNYLIENHSRFLICESTFISFDYCELDYLCSNTYRNDLKDPRYRNYNYFNDNKGFLKISFSPRYCTGINDYLDNIRKYLYPNCLPNCEPCNCWMTNDYIFILLQSASYPRFIREYLALNESDKAKVLWELAHPMESGTNLELCINHVSECELLSDSEKSRLIEALLTNENHIVSPGSHVMRGIR